MNDWLLANHYLSQILKVASSLTKLAHLSNPISLCPLFVGF